MGKRWTDKNVKDLAAKRPGTVREIGSSTSFRTKAAQCAQAQQSPTVRKKGKRTPARTPPELREMINWLSALKIPFETEYFFHEKRKWRFDIAIPAHKLAIEYEGIFSDTSRHTTIVGYTADACKYNAAQLLGWKVLRYTSKNHKQFLHDITAALNLPTI